MKNTIFLLFLLSLSVSYSQNNAKKTIKKVHEPTNNLELIAVKNDSADSRIDYTLKVKNNGTKTVQFLQPNEVSFMNKGIPAVEFVAETLVDGKWKKFKDPKIPQIDYYIPKFKDLLISIEPNEEKVIGGRFWRNMDLSCWFKLLDDVKLRVYFVYRINSSDFGGPFATKDEIKELGIKPFTLVSNKIEIEFKNTLSKKEYEEKKREYLKYALIEFGEKNYTSDYFLKNLKPIKNSNGEIGEILAEALGNKPYKYIASFTGTTKDGYEYRGILYKSDNVSRLGIYIGKHYLSKKKNNNKPLEYLFGNIPYNPNVLYSYLYKD